MIFALNTLVKVEPEDPEQAMMISDSAAYTVMRIIEEASNEISPEILGNTKISFETFADWYTKGGFQDTLWLELVDLHKWPSLDQQHGYVFDLHSGFRLEISIDDGSALRNVVRHTQLYALSPDVLSQVTHSLPRVSRKYYCAAR